jgi:hypothetical protein
MEPSSLPPPAATAIALLNVGDIPRGLALTERPVTHYGFIYDRTVDAVRGNQPVDGLTMTVRPFGHQHFGEQNHAARNIIGAMNPSNVPEQSLFSTDPR